MPQTTKELIAVVGTACHFPGGATTPSTLWELLKEPRDVLKTVPEDRFNADAWHHRDSGHHGTSNATKSYFLEEDPRAFDAQFFSIPPNECEAIDPQQRLLMESVYESLCAAGISMESLRGSKTACYVGQMCDDWSGIMMRDWDSLPQYTATGISRSIMSNRISYFFDWHGPSMTIDTADSSSLVAVHEAVRFLRSGESRVAVACGSNLILSPGMYIAESKLEMVSPDGRSRMWDEDANGYARGEGVAAIVLKTLSDALADGDHIECVIRETALNQDGKTTGLTTPSNTAHTELIRETYKKAGLDPAKDRPQFFQAHGTGTQAGDPEEAEAITNAFFEPGEQSDKLFVGSIKTVIGHTEGTAGLASLIGTSLALQNRTIPPNMHFSKLSQKVAPFYSYLEVPTSAQPWPEPRNGHPLRASVSSLGFGMSAASEAKRDPEHCADLTFVGGTNAHAILERYNPEIHGKAASTADAEVAPTALSTPLTFSANSQKSLRAMLSSYSEHLQSKDTNLRDLAWTLQHRRSVLPFRLAISGKSKDEILKSIGSALSQDDKLGHQFTGAEKQQLCILGVFTGQGAQWPAMGRALLHASPHVRGLIARMDESLQALPEADRPAWSIAEELEKKEASRVAEAAFSQPLCTAVQIILVELTRAAGIHFRAVVGHSSGEIGAAYAAGLVSAHDAIRVAYYRGLYAKLAKGPSGEKGAMMAVGTSLEDAREFCKLESFEGRVTVAASNSAASITLSGNEDAIDEAEEVFKDESKFARKLKVDTAYHSFQMGPCSGPYLQALEACGLASTHLDSAATTWYSSVNPGAKMTRESMNSQYWVDNMKNPVYFSQAVTAAVQDAGPFDVVLEVGPHPALKGPCLNNIEDASPEGSPVPPYIGLLSRGACDLNSFSSALGSLWEHFGPSAVDFDSCDKLISGESAPKKLATDLPTYPWNHDRAYWFESRVSGSYRHRQHSAHPLLGTQCAENSTGRQVQWRKVLHQHEVPWLAGHKLRGTTVFPVAGYVCAAIEALVAVAESPARLIEVTDFAAGRTISFPSESAGAQEISFTLKFAEDASAGDRLSATFQVSSCPQGERAMHLNAQGRVVLHLGQQNPALISTTKLAEHNMVDVDADRFYDSLAGLGHHYSPPFKAISSLRRRLDHAVGQLSEVRRGAHAGWADRLLLHPALLDSCFQTVLAAYSAPGDERLWTLHVPTRIERLALNPALAAPEAERLVWPWQTVVTSTRGGTVSADIEVFSANGGGGDVFLAVEGVRVEPFAQASPADDCRLFSNFVYELAQPDGGKADVAGEVDVRMAQDSERFAFYWIRQTLASVTAEEEAGALQHHKRMLAWFRFSHDQVAKGQHPHVKPSALQDTESQVEALVASHASRADIKLIRVVGKSLPAVIANGGDNSNNNIAEHMGKGGLLDAFYEEGTRSMARIALQLTHRYPHARIIEVGGGSTCGLADLLGESFVSYTVTDSSRTAKQHFRDDGRFIFKALDLESDVVEQGFEEGAYDFVFTSNALDASDDIMRNVRKLVRPGGWLVDLETLPYFRSAFAMAGSPRWWSFGAESGSPSVDEWDKLYRRTGWSGVDTFTSNLDGLHPFTVLVTQAVDERVNYLRAPLAIPHPDVTAKSDELVLVGGRSEEVAGIAERVTELLSDHFASITRVESLEEFADSSSQVKPVILNLGELDVPVMQELFEQGQADRLDALRAIFSAARDILWVTNNSRDESPFSRATVGMAQALCKEYPTANFQALDVGELDSHTSPQVVAETLLRHAALRNWSKEKAGLLWSREPELYIEDGKLLIPRLRSARYVNDRYNSSRRRITHEVPPSTQPVELVGVNNNTWDLVLPSPLKQAPESTASDNITLHVTHSLLHAVKIPMAGHYFLFHGTDPRTNDAYVALSATSASVVNVPLAWTIPFKAAPKGPSIPAILLALAANLLVEPLLAALPASGTLLAHDPDPIIAAALAKQAAAGRGGGARSSKTRVYFTTITKNSAAKKPTSGAAWLVLDPRAPRRHLKKLLPRTITTFVDLSNRSSSGSDASPAEAREAALVSSIAALLPHGAVLASSGSNSGTSPFLLSNRAQPRTGGNFGGEAVGKILASGWAKAKASSFAAAAPASAGGDLKDRVVPLASVPGYTARELRVVDWRADTVVAARVVPIDAESGGQLLKADATYLLVGLAGGVGWSIAQWMVQRGGARNVVLASSEPGKVDERWVDALEEEYGATVKAVSL
ncbi:Beta-ketoacyl synthase [Macrophomina phaseolina MS6]|uniref:Beta-ketoacyl synthase n=1 Tax=Macrophomina phaseolina (strain MS6) TaxID=1126212 RepID=K2RKN8_MACPH|nr:Beta-ketoacyl synthase [Macrophomina phaseolina MS6]